MGDHALLSPSSSKQWLNCPPSARLGEDVKDETSVFAEEGTEAHALCEYKVQKALGRVVEDPRPGMRYLDSVMEECSDAYRDFIMQIVEEEKAKGLKPSVFIEERLDVTAYVPGCFGTGDCIIISGNTLRIIDFKYGVGVPVDSEGNTQMMIYGLGAWELYSLIYDIEKVEMTIYQPRIGNISTSVLDACVLVEWAEKYLSPIAEKAWKGEGELKPGDWCRFCKVKAQCRARAEENMKLARMEFRKANLLSDEELSEVLAQGEHLVSWVNDVRDYAMALALQGKNIPGWKLVAGRAVRKYTDEDAVIAAVKNAGYDPFESKLLGITAMTSRLGRKGFDEVLGGLVRKAPGKPTLVAESDRRPAIAISDFKDMEE